MTPLFEDDDWLVLDKPAGLLTTPLPGRASLVDQARARRPEARAWHPLSRLDTDVTGAVIFALTPRALAAADHARAHGGAPRVYLALTSPAPKPPAGAWRWPVAVDPAAPTRRKAGEHPKAVPAETRYACVDAAGEAARVLCAPVTGRTHQIRVHASKAAAPVLGDGAYGGARRVVLPDGEVVGVARVMLHAWRVWLPGSMRAVEAPAPDDLAQTWRALGGHDAWPEGLDARVDSLTRRRDGA